MSKELKSHRIYKSIMKLEDELVKHQNKCKHKNATKKWGGNTGNYDPSADCYWTEFHCPTCLKRWTVDGNI